MANKLIDKVATGPRMRAVLNAASVLFTLAVFVGGGFVIGFWTRDNIAQDRRAQLMEEHRQDLERRDSTYRQNLLSMQSTMQYLTGRVAQTALTAEGAANTSEAAATAAQKAASTAQKAVTQSNIAINKAAQVPEPTRDQINSAVKRANRGQK